MTNMEKGFYAVLGSSLFLAALGGGHALDKAETKSQKRYAYLAQLIPGVNAQIVKDGFEPENTSVQDYNEPDPSQTNNSVDLRLGQCVFYGVQFSINLQGGKVVDTADYSAPIEQTTTNPNTKYQGTENNVSLSFGSAQQLEQELPQINCFPK